MVLEYAAAQLPQILLSRAATNYGRSKETQRRIIDKMVLSL
jgi:hypothetical protein